MSIGGYFEFELPKGKEYHQYAIRLNTGRNAFEYLLRAKKYNKVYLPYYFCSVMLEPVTKLELQYEFYHINESFRPIFDFSQLHTEDVFVYINYFGICDTQVSEVSGKCKNLVVDNSQAFFAKPEYNVDTFYSPRKFFGVPDGAYLYTKSLLNRELPQDVSSNRTAHLLGRIELGAEENYQTFREYNSLLCGQPIKKMSNLTHRLLESINYANVLRIRRKNFIFLNDYLGKTNQLKIKIESEAGPMVYPFLITNGSGLKKKIIAQKIYVATYWPNVLQRTHKDSWEHYLANNLIAFPIDQRYHIYEMKRILKSFL